jgi:hypothetical protein
LIQQKAKSRKVLGHLYDLIALLKDIVANNAAVYELEKEKIVDHCRATVMFD